MKVTLVAGARPNFMKIAPIIHAIQAVQKESIPELSYRLVHTGQHYDKAMSDTFFLELDIPEPDVNLGVGSGTQSTQTAAIMVGFERDLQENPADLVIVVGDVNSTMACAIVAKKLHTKVAHVEGGIRSGDILMPEEVNRIVTDSISDYFFTTTHSAGNNLIREGKSEEQIFFVGNTMIDTLMRLRDDFIKPPVWDEASLREREYMVMTLHRPSNVDDPLQLQSILNAIGSQKNYMPIIFPVHPRTKASLDKLESFPKDFHITTPLGYKQFNYLVKRAKGVVTDSGGITEEATVMGIPCITLRDSTERPETVEEGTNELVGSDPIRIANAMQRLMEGKWKEGRIPEKWDGKAAQRLVSILKTLD